MTIDQRVVGAVVVMDLKGRIGLVSDASPLEDRIGSLLLKGHRRFLLNMERVSHIDSGGLGLLASLFDAVRHHGGQIKLVNANSRVHETLAIVKLLTVFEHFNSETDALKSYA